MKLQTSGVLGTSYAIAKLAPKRGKFLVEDVYQEAGIHYLKFKQIQ